MTLFLGIMGGIVFIVMLSLILSNSNKADQLTKDNADLKRRNDLLEKRFSQEEEHAPATPAPFVTGVEILQTFAQSHQITLKSDENFEDENWELFLFVYQDGHFYSYANKRSDEVLIRHSYFYSLPYTEDALIRVLHLCHDYAIEHRFVKIRYTLETNDSGEQIIDLHLYYDMMGVSQAGLEFLLYYNFELAHDIREKLNDKTEAADQPQTFRKPMSRNQE